MKGIWILICLSAIAIVLSFYAGRLSTERNATDQVEVQPEGLSDAKRNALDQLEPVIKQALEEESKKPQQNRVLVAIYLDTEESENSMAKAEYRCYSSASGRGGYSGIKRIPFKTPWVIWERIRPDNSRKIIIDPGPPYKNVTKIITLIPGEVTNLGRIVLEKVQDKGTASICGTIRDENGKPLNGVEVFSKKGVVTTNAEGFYSIDGFGLEVCNLNTEKKGYIPYDTKVSIRNMDKRIIKQDFVLSVPRKVRFRYVISPGEKDDFSCPEATSGTGEFLIDKKYFRIPTDEIENEDFRRFAGSVYLNFRISGNKLTLDNSYAPIFYRRLSSSSEKFETINSVGELSYNSQHCPAIQAGDMILINGGKVSDYTLKILFEEVQFIIP